MFRRFGVFLLMLLPVTAQAVTCDPDQYLDGEFCYTCPANATCDGTNFTCNPGWFSDGAICTQCSVANSSCTGPDDYSCLPGFYDSDGKCNACPDNATCAGGHEYFYCKPGWYKSDKLCKSCTGHFCDGETLVSCGDGYYKQGEICLKCPSTYYCPAGTTNMTRRCQAGYYVDGNKNCQICPTGYFCPFAESTVDNMYDHCASGYYRTGGSCSKCPDDIVCPGGKMDEMTCPDGLYKHDNGQCLSYAPGDCGTAPNCNPGCWNNGGQCTPCIAEYSTCTDENNFTCMAGYYKNGQSCEMCPENSNCPAGSMQISCLPGYYLDGNECSQCGMAAVYCINNIKYDCPEYIPGSVDPYLPTGYRVIKATNLMSMEQPIQSTISECVIVYMYISTPIGEYFNLNSGWNSNTNAYTNIRDIKYWYSANPGYYLSSPSSVGSEVYYLKIKECTNGAENSYYTGSGSPEGNDCPWVCNDGFYRDGNECLTCPPGMNCAGGGIVCPIGMYADKNQCLACPSGYTDAQTNGAQSIDMCQKRCDGGTYVATPESNTCANVGAGYWIGENYTNYGATGTRNACDGGMTTLGYGAGADEAADCGRTLHVGDKSVHLRSARRTSPSLVVKYSDKLFYGDMSSNAPGNLKIKVGDTTYSVYDDSMIE